MFNGRNRNRNEWAQLTQSDDFAAFQQQTYFPGGYAQVPSYAPSQGYLPAHGYAPAGSYDGYGECSNSYTYPYSAHESQGMSSNMIGADVIPEQEVGDSISPEPHKRESPTPARSQAQPRSRRSEVRERIARENNGEVSANDQPKGLVEWRRGIFKYWDPEDQKWLKAAYHDQYRDQFIEEDAQAVGDYVIAPAAGRASNDLTSSCAAFNQLEWDLNDRSKWDNVVDMDGNKVLYLIERPANQSYDLPDRHWIQDGFVLLDGDNNPVRPWAGVPRCFSSKIEGARMEALRRILPMTIQDFRARMPRFIQQSKRAGAQSKPLSNPSTFGHRTSRFRAQYQIPAFVSRAASDILKKQITDQLPEAEEATTTEGLKALTRHEVDHRKLSTRGKYLYKATGRAISEGERKLRHAKLDQKLERQAKARQQSQSTPATPAQSVSQSPHLAITPLSANNKRRRLDDLEATEPGLAKPAPKRSRRGAASLDPSMGSPLSTLFEDDREQGPVKHEEGKTTATASNDDPPPTELDYRFTGPQTPLQQLRIQAALFYPRAHFFALTREHPPHTSEGSYIDQYLQIVALLEQKWLIPGEAPALADIGPWYGSFDVVPAPILEDGVMWSILNLGVIDIKSGGESSHGSTVEVSAENVETNLGSDIGAGNDTEWDGDFFDQF